MSVLQADKGAFLSKWIAVLLLHPTQYPASNSVEPDVPRKPHKQGTKVVAPILLVPPLFHSSVCLALYLIGFVYLPLLRSIAQVGTIDQVSEAATEREKRGRERQGGKGVRWVNGGHAQAWKRWGSSDVVVLYIRLSALARLC